MKKAADTIAIMINAALFIIGIASLYKCKCTNYAAGQRVLPGGVSLCILKT